MASGFLIILAILIAFGVVYGALLLIRAAWRFFTSEQHITLNKEGILGLFEFEYHQKGE